MEHHDRTCLIRTLIEKSLEEEPYYKIQDYIGPGKGASHLRSMIDLKKYEFDDNQIQYSIGKLRKAYGIINGDDDGYDGDTVMGGTENEPSTKRSRHDHPSSSFSTPLRQSMKGHCTPSRTFSFRGSRKGLSPQRRHNLHRPVTNFTIPPSSSTLSSSDNGIADLFGGLTLNYDDNDGNIREIAVSITEKDVDTIIRDLCDNVIDVGIVKSVKKDTETLEMEYTNDGGDKDALILANEISELTSKKVRESCLFNNQIIACAVVIHYV